MPLAQAAAAAARPQPEGQENSGEVVAAGAAAGAASANLQGNGVQNNVAYPSSSGPADQVDPDSEIRDDELEEPSEVEFIARTWQCQFLLLLLSAVEYIVAFRTFF